MKNQKETKKQDEPGESTNIQSMQKQNVKNDIFA
jgi:hypothetical protein